jgi:H+/gluconate symporter-like permease
MFLKRQKMDKICFKKVKLAHDSLLKEIHNIDHITEMHAQIVIAIQAALIAFVSSKLESPEVICIGSFLGILICIEWILKVVRHRHIFRESHDKLEDLEISIGIEGLRPVKKKPYKKLFSFDGFTILIWFAMVLIVFWIVIGLLFEEPSQTSSLLGERTMDAGSWIGIAGIAIGCIIAFWQWHDAKVKGSLLVAFLHGLKASNLPDEAVEQINDMLSRLDPPKKPK